MGWYMAIMQFSVLIQAILQFRFAAKYTGKAFQLHHCLIYILCVALCGFAGRIGPPIFISLMEILALYGASRTLLKNDRIISGLAAVLTTSIALLSWGFLNSLANIISSVLDDGAFPSMLLVIRSISAIFSLILCFCFFYLVERRFTLPEENTGPYLLLILFPVLLSCATGLYMINSVYGNTVTLPFPSENGKELELLLIQALGFCAILSTLYSYGKLCESFRIKSRLAMLIQETNAQKAYVTEARTRYEQTRAFRHDIRNHLSVLGGLLKSGHSKQAAGYLEKLGACVDDLSLTVQTGNPVIDVLLNSKLEMAGHLGIQIDISLNLPKTWKADDLDLCVILSNALDNAIAACRQVREHENGGEENELTIRVTGERQGDFYLLEFENPCPEGMNQSPVPGTGLSNIKTVAEKYSGAVMIEHDSGCFCLDVLLNMTGSSYT